MSSGRAQRARRARTPLPGGFGVIWTTVALDLIGFGIILPVLPRFAEDSGASPTTAGLLVASFSFAQLVFSPLWGRVSDRVGRKPVLIVSLFGTAVGSLLTGLAGELLWLLFVARLIDGASGASVSVAQAAVVDLAPPEQRARLLGLLGAAFGAGFALGPAIGGLAALVDHRLPFFVAAVIAAANALVAVRRLPETRPAAAPANPALANPALAGPTPEDSPAKERPDGRQSDGEKQGGGELVQLVTVSFLSLVAFSAFEATFSLLAKSRFGLTESATYAVFALIGVAIVVVQVGLVHPIGDRLGESPTVRAGLVANAFGLALVGVDAGWLLVSIGLALLVMGQGLLIPTLAAAVANRARQERRGFLLGVQQSAGGAARIVGPAIGGALFQHVGPSAPYAVGAGLAGVAALLVPHWRARSPAGMTEPLPNL